MRTIIDISDGYIKILQELCDRFCESRAQIIRQAIEEYVARHATAEDEKAFGIWKNKPETSLEYESKLRTEWDRS